MRLIDASELIQVLCVNMDSGEQFDKATHCVDVMPTVDAVPVIRCKDCRYCAEKKGTAINKHCTWWYRTVDDDDYCSRAERKEE